MDKHIAHLSAPIKTIVIAILISLLLSLAATALAQDITREELSLPISEG